MKTFPFALLASVAFVALSTTAVADSAPPTEKVEGIGGFFFLGKDPKGLAKWYQDNLGINLTPENYGGTVWQQTAGPTAFQPFDEASALFGKGKQWMINFRVRNLEAMVRQLTAAKIKVKVDPTVYPNGRFAHLRDPEGNLVELWEPKHAAP